MAEVRLRLLKALDRVALRRLAGTEPRELREDVPHPMCPLPAATDFPQGLFVDGLLRVDEARQIKGVLGTHGRITGDDRDGGERRTLPDALRVLARLAPGTLAARPGRVNRSRRAITPRLGPPALAA